MFDWNDLKYFLEVARRGSTLAKTLGVNQSTVHRRLSELEKQFGHRLVVRQPAGYRLTELGRDVVAHVERVKRRRRRWSGASPRRTPSFPAPCA